MILAFHILGHQHQRLLKVALSLSLALLLLITGCSSPPESAKSLSTVDEKSRVSKSARLPLQQVEPPALIQELTPWLTSYEPQVHIRQPQADQVFDDTTISIVLRVQDLPIYKDKTWEIGPHIELILDNQPYGPVYDLDQPVILKDLTPGTHTIRAFATRPWYESFKNEGAYDQVTFHIFAKTDENSPKANQPLLTYGAPVGTYGAEPILLDFYLNNAPLHQVAQDNPAISDWRIRYTINGDDLTLKNWESIYIEGLKPGQNWVQLSLVDDAGKPMDGVFNNTVRLIEYDPDLDDTLAKIVRGDVTLETVGSIIDPTYEPPVSEPVEPLLTEDATAEELETVLETDTAIPEASEPETSEPETSDNASKSLEKTSADHVSDDNAVGLDESASTTDVDSADVDLLETPEDISTNRAIEETSEDMSAETWLENDVQPVEETEADTDRTDSFDSESDFTPAQVLESESSSEPAVEAATQAEPTADSLEENTEEHVSESPVTKEVTPPQRRYFQGLYDYRDRAMRTHER